MCLEITYSAIAKYRETFFGALKTAQNEKPYVFQEIDIPEINMCLFGNFQNLYTSSLMPCLHTKLRVVGKWNCPWKK